MVSARLFAAAPLLAAVPLLHGCGGGGDDPSPDAAGSCTPDQDVADCQNVDFGTCGNACCRVQASVQGDIADVVKVLNSSLAKGGADGGYTLQGLFGAEGLNSGGLGFEPIGEYGYLGQVHHMTSGPKHYNDTINFHITASEDNKTTIIEAFSLSLIGGALGDNGQGYKNIMFALRGAGFGDGNSLTWDGSVTNLDSSCPGPSKEPEIMERRMDDTHQVRRLDDVVGSCTNTSLPGCQNLDLGSCGNACCSLKVTVNMPASEAVVALNKSFAQGGADGNYRPSALAEEVLGFANLTGLAPSSLYPGQIYIGQVIHMTSGQYHFNDTVNFNLVSSENGTQTVITAFSLSLIGGAFGDSGQNYKNIKMAMDEAFPDGATIEPGNFPKSCPAPKLV